MSNFIEVKNVSFSYINDFETPSVKNTVISDLSLEIERGEFVAILGHNGSGKSTLAKMFNAINLPESGDIFISGMNTKDEANLFDIRKTVGMVFQNPDNQIVATIVEEDVAFALENIGVEPSEIRRKVDEALNTVGMYKYREHAPHKLSGGQKQRIAIAGVLALSPECIVMDEPTAMLDPIGRREIMKTIKQLNSMGVTIILITHYMEEAAQAGRVIVMDNGKIILDDEPKRVFSQCELLKSVGLDVPQVTELTHVLIDCGLPLANDIISEEECVQALYELLKKEEN